MLAPEEAKQQLARFADPEAPARRRASVEALPERQRTPARMIIRAVPSELKSDLGARAGWHAEAAQALDELDDDGRQRVFATVFPSLARETIAAIPTVPRSP